MTNNVETFSLNDTAWQGIVLTDNTAKHICHLVEKNPEKQGLSLNIKPSGCTGYGYVIELATGPNEDDIVYEHNGAKLFVSLKAMPFIDGLVVDYVREGLNQMFKFNNPKAQNVCGCGESFGV
ncbi:Fe-S cluster assembly scaffold SufA [Proteus sp. NMG38-2]|uniref:Fe-S cluster assembly scaffold SufA n=1 Tax=Proteus sp. NMG38-2 TaxID=2883107 RepID=UPI001D0A3762|nr:Fe-S cluster assembly scaffold SufA [Proteus sp. NMG38-2]UDN37694.1 Fe-S cluster assembly scaffold SufA [Proteus sp. NMG38-2]